MSPTICVQKNNPCSFTKPLLGWSCVILSDYFVCDEIQLLLQSLFQNTKTLRTGMSWPVNEQVICEMHHSCWTATPRGIVSDKAHPVICNVLLQVYSFHLLFFKNRVMFCYFISYESGINNIYWSN